MKAWTKDQRNQLNVELRGQGISSENVQSSTNDDDFMPTSNPPIFSSPHNTQNNSERLASDHSGYRNMRQRPMSCKPRSIPAKRRFRQQGFSSSNESLSSSEMTGNKSNKEKAIAVAWAEKDYQTNDLSKEINDCFPSMRMFQKRDQKEKILFDNGISEGLGETQVFHTNAFPARRMTMSLQHQTSAKGKKTPLMSASSPKNSQSQGETSLERHKCVIPVPSKESTVYDSIDTERLLRLNLSDPELISHLQEELISRRAGESKKYLSIMAPPSSPRAGSPTHQADSSFSAQKGTNNTDIFSSHSDINTTPAECTERPATSSPKNSSIINLCDVSTAPSSPRSSSIVAQNIEERTDKSLESDRRDNKPLNSGCASSGEEGTLDKEPPVTDVRVRSVQLLCTHSGRFRHSATLVESYPLSFPTKYQLSEKEGSKTAPMASNKVFVSKSNYKPIRMVYEEKEQCKPQETGIPVTVPHLQRYLSNLQKKQMKLKETRGMSPQGRASSLPLADGIYKTTKTYEFSPHGPQEIVQKTLICKNSLTDKRPKTSNSTPVANKTLWKTRPQSGPSRFLTNQNIGRKTSSTKVFGGDKQIKKRENQNPNRKEPKQPEVCKLQNSLDDEDDSSHVSIESQSTQIIPRVHFESKLNNRSVPLNSILKKGSQENQLVNSLDSDPKEKALVLNVLESSTTFEHPKNIPENSEKHKTTISEELHNPKLNNTSPNKYENDYNKVTKSQTGILFNGIGASSDFGRIKDVSPRETKKPLEREASIILTSTHKDLDTAVNAFKKGDLEEKKRVSFHPQECDSLLTTIPLHTENSSEKEKSFEKEKDKTDSNNFHQELKNPEITETKEKESEYYLTSTRYIQTDKKETSSNTLLASKDYNSNRRLSGSFSIYRSGATDSLSTPSALITSQKEVKTETQPQPTKVKSERKSGSSKKGKSGKGRSRPKSSKPTGPPLYLTTVKAQNPIDEDDFECEQLSDKLMEHGVYVSWKTIRGGLYPPAGRSLHYEIADTGLVPPSDLLSHPKNWFPKEYKELQRATKNLERAELSLWKQKRAEEKKFGSKRKRKLTKKKKK